MISFKNVTKKDKELVLLDDITFDIEDKSVVCFFGKSDVGKTELFKTFIDNKRINSGTVDMELSENNKIGVVFKNFEKNVGLTVYEYLVFYAKCFEIDLTDKQINEMLYKYKLNLYKNIVVDKLNKSTKRLLSLAKAMLNDPEILLLESPMSDVNDNIKRIIKEVLVDSIGKKTIIFTANNMIELGDICSHCGVLENGRLLMYGTVEDVLEKMQLSMMIELKVVSDEDNKKAIKLLQEDERVDSILVENGNIIFSIDGSIEDEADILKLLVSNDIEVCSFSKDSSSFDFSLEDIDSIEEDMIINKEEF